MRIWATSKRLLKIINTGGIKCLILWTFTNFIEYDTIEIFMAHHIFSSSIPILVLVALLIFSCSAMHDVENKTSEESKQPNLVIILVDDLGYADVGFNGCKDIPTPNIDRIASEGVRFSNGYVSFPVCGPSRAGLITGRYQGRFGFSRNPLFAPNDPTMGLPLEEETLAEALQRAGYRCAALGKWHLGAHPSQRPLKRGFDEFFGFLTGGHRYYPEEWTLQDEYEVTSQFEAYRTKLLRNDERIEESEYLTDALSREAAQYVEKFRDNPFFIYLAYNAPHAPLQATDKYLKRFSHITEKKRKTYAAMVSAVDEGVGLLLNKLDSLQLSDNTIVVFLSDNGGPRHITAVNKPLRGYKGNLLEGGIRVPFAIRWPDEIPGGLTYDHPVISLDIFATITGQQPPGFEISNSLDGVNLLPYLKGEKKKSPHDQLFWRKYGSKEMAIREGDYKLTNFTGSGQIYHLENDIGEKENLFGDKKPLAKMLRGKHEKWLNQLIDPVFLGLSQDSIYNVLNPGRFDRPDSIQ